jgi:hypothetical protein
VRMARDITSLILPALRLAAQRARAAQRSLAARPFPCETSTHGN